MSTNQPSPGDGNAPAAVDNAHQVASAPSRPSCVVDLDNLLHRGVDKSTGQSRPRAELNVMAFASDLRARGIVEAVICRNWNFHLLEQRLWNALGFETVATRANCDPQVMRTVEALVDAGCREFMGYHVGTELGRELQADGRQLHEREVVGRKLVVASGDASDRRAPSFAASSRSAKSNTIDCHAPTGRYSEPHWQSIGVNNHVMLDPVEEPRHQIAI